MMTRDFFERRTGFKPTETEWTVIRSEYTRGMEDPGDFCDRFVREEKPKEWGESRGMIIECMYSMYLAQRRYYEGKLAAKEQEAAEAIANLSGKVAALQEALDRELGWKLAEGVGTHMEQDEYEDLTRHGREMTEERAKQRVCREFGFDFDRVEIKRCAEVFERNKYGELRVREINVRPPVYEAEGKDYVRFDCAGYQYEMVNGELMRYED